MPLVNRLSLTLAATALPLIFGACPALAETAAASAADATRIEEVVVTAQKREQNLIEVPAAVTALSGAKLSEMNLASVAEVSKLTPNFSVSYERGENSTPNFTLRGISGDTLASRLNESSVSVYADEVFLGDQTALNGSLFDIGRVEVLRGPQGTLFGKNTTGGLVHFISAKPTSTLSGYGSFEYGDNDKTAIEGAVSGPLSDKIRARISGRWDRNDGNYVNDYAGAGQNGIEKRLGGTDIYGLRGIVDLDLNEDTLLRIIASYVKSDSEPVPGRALGYIKPTATPANFPFSGANICSPSQGLAGACVGSTQIFFGGAPNAGRKPGHGITNLTPADLYVKTESPSYTATLTHDLGWGTFTSITNYMRAKFAISFDGDFGLTPTINSGLNIIAYYGNKSDQFSQEFRVNGSTNSVDWVVGAFVYADHKKSHTHVNFLNLGLGPGRGVSPLGFTQQSDGAIKTNSYAVFGQIDAHLTDTLTVTAGGRLTKEIRELTQASTNFVGAPVQNVLASVADPKTNNMNFTGKVALSWMPNAESNYYVSISSGVKSAGYNTGFSPSNTLAQNVAVVGPVKQETIEDIEAGAKNLFLDGRLSINSSVFYYHFDGKQEDYFTFDGLTSQENYLNVGTARLYGAETEINFRPNSHWDFNLSGGVLDTKITDSNVVVRGTLGSPVSAKGKPLVRSPKWTFSAIAAYHLPLDNLGVFTLQGEANGRDKQSYAISGDPYTYDRTHVFVNLRLLWTSADQRFNAQAYVTNLFKEESESRMYVPGLQGANPVAFTGSANTAEGLGRLWGVKVGAKF